MKHQLILLSSILILWFSPSYGQGRHPVISRIDSLLNTTQPRSFNGVVMITQKNKTIYARAHGYADLERSTPLDLKDRFRIQSNTKQVTAVLVLTLAEAGKIDLNSPIRRYLPEASPSWTDTVTVHQLLNMSAGITHLDRPLAFKPGTGFLYSNPAYGLLGKILEKVSGKSYIALANTLFKSLGMANTYCYEMNKANPGLINGHLVSGDSVEIVRFDRLGFTAETWKNFIPTGGIISNLEDLNKWDRKLHGGGILKTKSYNAMIQSNVVDVDKTFSDGNSFYGYGVNISGDRPLTYIGHAGRGLGFVSIKFYVPERELDVIVLENVYHRDISAVYHFEREIRKIMIESLN